MRFVQRVAGPDEAFVVDEVIDDERRLARRPVRRAQRPHVEELAVDVEHLHALMAAVDDEQPPVGADRDAVHGVELVRPGIRGILRRRPQSLMNLSFGPYFATRVPP